MGRPTVVDFTATDDLTGVFKTEFSLDNGVKWTTGNAAKAADGVYTILFRSMDFFGNVETSKSIDMNIDSTAPVTTANTHYHVVKGIGPVSLEVDFVARDNVSGVAKTEYSLDHGANWKTGTTTSFATSGTYTILYRSTDVAGNVERRQSITVTVAVNNN